MFKMKNTKYIYSLKFASSLIEKGYKMIDTGYDKDKKVYYWAFNSKEIQPFYLSLKNN